MNPQPHCCGRRWMRIGTAALARGDVPPEHSHELVVIHRHFYEAHE